MLKIGKPYIESNSSCAKLCADLCVDGHTQTIWFSVTLEYAQFLTAERADPFIVALLYYAMRNGHDIKLEAAVTERLLYQIRESIVKALHKAEPAFREIRISCQTAPPLTSCGAVATGISCGVDSISTICRHLPGKTLPAYTLTHLTFFNAGAAYYDNGEKVLGPDGLPIEQHRLENARCFAKDVGLPLIEVDSNISEFLKLDFALTHTYRNCAAALVLQRLISVYYYASSGFPTMHMAISPHNSAGHYDDFTLPNLSTGAITFYSSMHTFSRLQKTMQIADEVLAHRYLNVCFRVGKNCGRCPKCIRTLTTLDALGRLDAFDKVFDIADYRLHRAKRIAYVLANRSDPYCDEIYHLLRKEKKIPYRAYLYVPKEKIANAKKRLMRFLAHKLPVSSKQLLLRIACRQNTDS